MDFKSIMFLETDLNMENQVKETPDYFRDLNLEQIIDSITSGMEKYKLKPFFFTPLHSKDTINYRQEIMRDLEENEELLKTVETFSENVYEVSDDMKRIREYLAKNEIYYNNYLQKGRLLDSAKTYCESIRTFAKDISSFSLKSRGLQAFRKYISDYIQSDAFISLAKETEAMKAELSKVKYCMLIKDNIIKVQKYGKEIDYTVEIEKIFQKFKQGAVKDVRKNFTEDPHAEHVEAGVLNNVKKLYPKEFENLDSLCERDKNFVDEKISVFSQEIQFYIAYIEYMQEFKKIGLNFCYPKMAKNSKEIHISDSYDLALAEKLLRQGETVVLNDFFLKGRERIIVVSGPNQGGKTTFARLFGQIHHLANLGCPVPGSDAQLYIFDNIFTHFEKEEDIKNLSGKLQDDLIRMHEILCKATPQSIIIINEFLSSTALKDAVTIGREIMKELVNLDSLCVWVTFLDELSAYNEKNVSMVSTVMPDDPSRRTYKIIRSPADGLAYAIHIADKYRLTYSHLKERVRQ